MCVLHGVCCVGGLSGDISVGIKCDANVISDQEEDVDFDIIPNANDTITVKYIPPGAGRLTIKVLFTDQVSEQKTIYNDDFFHLWKYVFILMILSRYSMLKYQMYLFFRLVYLS